MTRSRAALLAGAALLVGSTGFVLATRGPEPPSPTPPGAFSFAAMGDSPYYFFEDLQYRVVLQDLAQHDLALVLHVGDLFWTRCTDERYRRSLEEFRRLPHPVIYTPGDNEWTDCWQHSLDFPPERQLARIREIFFADPTSSLGGRPIPLAHQEGEFVENARWRHESVVFATFHLVGGGNGSAPFPDRTEAADGEVRRRTEAAAAWLRETFARAREADAPAVVLAFHANPGFAAAPDYPGRLAYEPFFEALEGEAAGFERPVLVIQGDHHDYIVDRPLIHRSTGDTIENVTRLQVPGSYDVGWVRVTVTPGAAEPFAFEPRIVPRWKYW